MGTGRDGVERYRCLSEVVVFYCWAQLDLEPSLLNLLFRDLDALGELPVSASTLGSKFLSPSTLFDMGNSTT